MELIVGGRERAPFPHICKNANTISSGHSAITYAVLALEHQHSSFGVGQRRSDWSCSAQL